MLELYLIRHPETEANVRRVIQGRKDTFLKKGYEALVDEVAMRLATIGEFDAFFSSDLLRTEEPARRITDFLRTSQQQSIEYHSTELLKERDFGIFENKRYETVPCDKNDVFECLFFMQDILRGESLDSIRKRIRKFREDYIKKYEGQSGRLGIVGHNNLNNYLRNELLLGDIAGPYKRMKNLEIVVIEIEQTPGGPKAREIPLSA